MSHLKVKPTVVASDLKQFEAVIFDMDGLLLDSERIALSAFLEACEHLGLPPQRNLFVRCIGTNRSLGREVLRQGLQGQVDHLVFERIWDSKYADRTSNGPIPLKEGAAELLDLIASLQIRIALATSTQTGKARERLAKCGLLEKFHAIVGGDQVQNSKPAPDIYLKAAAALAVRTGGCLALEDSENGVRAAVSAGMTVVQIPDLVEPSADLLTLGHIVLRSLADVAPYPFGQVTHANCQLSRSRAPP